MPRLSHDAYFLAMLELVAARTTCVRRKVGAILVSESHQILSTGYNGVPRGLVHCISSPCAGADDPKGDTRRCEAVHAEVNAILQCHRLDLVHTLYVTCTPCFECAKMLANTSLQRVVATQAYPSDGDKTLRRRGITLDILSAESAGLTTGV